MPAMTGKDEIGLNLFTEKLKEVSQSVLPIVLIVFILHFTISPLETNILIRFFIGALLIVTGLTIFLAGVDITITPIGRLMGKTMIQSKKIIVVVIAGILLGFIISAAEPVIHVFSGQVDLVSSGQIPKGVLVIVISLGVGLLMAAGLIRILFNISLYKMLMVIYLCIFVLAFASSPEFLAISFDAAGAITGALTVPFILALAYGVSMMKKDSKSSEEDSFGLVGITATGAITAVMLMHLFTGTGQISGSLEQQAWGSVSIIEPFWTSFLANVQDITIALTPFVLIFIVFQKLSFKMAKKAVRKMMMGFLYTFTGLILFLTGVNAGFMEAGSTMGYSIASIDNKIILLIVAFILGFVTILAEPLVYVLNKQIEEVTSGYVKGKLVTFSLAAGVGIAVFLSIVRILVPELQLWHILLPGYVISLTMMYFVPKLFTGMAFDSGCVASGPMSATFMLAFVQGAAEAIDGADVIADGFGMLAIVVLTPVIAIQSLGLVFKVKAKKGGLKNSGE